MKSWRCWPLFLLGIWVGSVQASAPVVLTISGHIQAKNGSHRVDFTVADLQKLPQQRYRTLNPWVSTPHTYQGPRLTDLLKRVGAHSQKLTLVALNDYRLDLNLTDIRKYQPIVAWSDNGQQMSLREHGPLWLMLPVSQYSELKASRYNQYMIWQLRQIIVQN
ncbi:molybdopterin-binding oxidoreductase [Celerinatantimonas yamalensis]|uniref:Molybdopterin-binding oxidoreductase n=1 Tax=Celerinatantimonas yamalensis TaxID=559956 RepID=A0ABW9G6J4_9GAMM